MDAPAQPLVSSSDIIQIITWLLMIISGFAFFARISTKWAMTKTLNSDDVASIASLALNYAAGASVSVLAVNGLGEDRATVSESRFLVFQKSLYALQLLYIATTCFAKLSVILLLRMISPSQLHRKLGITIGIFIAGWGFVSLMAALFQCSPPDVWRVDSQKCYNKAIFWHAVGGINIFTDLLLISLPLVIVARLQTTLRKRLVVIVCFGCRSFDIVATACQLAYTDELDSSNITSNLWPWVLCVQIVQTTSIITSCIPYLRPLLDAFPSGMYVNDDVHRHGTTNNYLNGYTKRSDHNYVLREVRSTSKTTSQASIRPTFDGEEDFSNREVQNTSRVVSERALFKDDQMNHSNQNKGMVIKATTTIETAWHDRKGTGMS